MNEMTRESYSPELYEQLMGHPKPRLEELARVPIEERIRMKALQLHPKAYPEFNLWPTMDLIRQAWALGLDVVRPPADPPAQPVSTLEARKGPATPRTPRDSEGSGPVKRSSCGLLYSYQY